jgi:PAS domain S-box-containing protein
MNNKNQTKAELLLELEELHQRVVELEQNEAERKRAEEAFQESVSHKNLLKILDSIDADVYVSDIDSNEILFMNQHMRIHFEGDQIGRFCWEVFRGESGSCPHCTNDQLLDADGNPIGVITWEGKNPLTGKWYINNDRAIQWVDGRIVRLQVATDITELKLAEKELLTSEQRYRTVIEQSPFGIQVFAPDGTLLEANRTWEEIWGAHAADVIGVYNALMDPQIKEAGLLPMIERSFSGEAITLPDVEYDPQTSGLPGRKRCIRTNAYPVKDQDGRILNVVVVNQDISANKKAEKALEESAAKMSSIFKAAPIGIGLVSDRTLLEVNEQITEMVGYSQDELVGKNARILYPTDEDYEFVGREKYAQIIEQGSGTVETRWQRKDGKIINILMSSSPLDPTDLSTGVTFTALDITERKLAEQALIQRAHESNALKTVSTQVSRTLSVDQVVSDGLRGVLWATEATAAFLLMKEGDDLIPAEVVFSDPNEEFSEFPTHKLGACLCGMAVSEAKPVYLADIFNDLCCIWEECKEAGLRSAAALPLFRGDEIFAVLGLGADSVRDFETQAEFLETLASELANGLQNAELFSLVQNELSERKKAEEALRKSVSELDRSQQFLLALSLGAQNIQQSKSPEQVLQTICDQIYNLGYQNTIFLLSDDKTHLELAHMSFNSKMVRAAEKLTGLSAEGYRYPIKVGNFFHDVLLKRKAIIDDPASNTIKDALPKVIKPFSNQLAKILGIEKAIYVPLIIDNEPIGMLSVIGAELSEANLSAMSAFGNQAAIALENSRLYRDATQRLERLASLHTIDQTITGSFDLEFILNVLLSQLRTHLEVDAAVVLRYQANAQVLVFSQGQGFHTTALQHTDLRIGQGYAGEVALQRRNLFIPVLNHDESSFKVSPLFAREGFKAYYGIPLIVKGKLVGVLEVFNRSALDPTKEWVDFLTTLGNQAAIAIDNLTLFNDLQKSHSEMIRAYDATIEGWARALELRDMETEGHSRRVEDMTITLANKLGIRNEALVHIRRGTLLHDIGKLGIPDRILQKPGPLTEEEWQVMYNHPVFAFEWLSVVEFLRPTLDIPYCHHEKWDGTGYPRGLKGEQIPLAARIFAVVDVWDALLSDRPYRKAWDEEKVLTYIQDQSEKHFDPQVVDAFISFIRSRS